MNGNWVHLATTADKVGAGDLDGGGTADLIGQWNGQGGVWVRYSGTNQWAWLATPVIDLAIGDMNGDGRADLLGTWNSQGVFYQNSMNGAWVQQAVQADQVTAGDMDGDLVDDPIGIWPGQAGIWVKYSSSGTYALLADTARDISAGKFRPLAAPAHVASPRSVRNPKLSGPIFGAGLDLSDSAPGGKKFAPIQGKNLKPTDSGTRLRHVAGPGETGFNPTKQEGLIPKANAGKPQKQANKKPGV